MACLEVMDADESRGRQAVNAVLFVFLFGMCHGLHCQRQGLLTCLQLKDADDSRGR